MKSGKFPKTKLGNLVELRAGYQLRESVEPIGDPAGRKSSGTKMAIAKGLSPLLVRFIQVRDLDRRLMRVNLPDVAVIPLEKQIDTKKYAVRKRDVLFLAKGSKPGAFNVPQSEFEAASDLDILPMSHFFIVTVKSTALLPEYLVWILNDQTMEGAIKKSMAGSGVPFIPKPAFLDYEVPIPPIEVQERIAALFDLHVRARELVAKRETLFDNLVSHLLRKQLAPKEPTKSSKRKQDI